MKPGTARFAQYLCLTLLTAAYLAAETPSFFKGADLSSLPELESTGVTYSHGGVEEDALIILKNHGFNSIRLRLWHTPEDPWCTLEQTILMGQRIKAAGLHFLLDIHYSDWWADPGSQTPPANWSDLEIDPLVDSVYAYTHNVLATLMAHDAGPDMVQIGNEIGCGMLWPMGAVCGENDTPDQWQKLANLLNAGSQAVRDAGDDSIQVMIHDFRGGDASGASWFYTHLDDYDVDYDVIGLSYYPWWHGSLADLAANMGNLAYYHEKPVNVVETAYPWTLEWSDNRHNIIGSEEQLLPEYPATPGGQLAFLEDLLDRIQSTWNGYGLGLYYWEPAWIPGTEAGTPWENLAIFDFQGEALPALTAFQEPVSSLHLAETPGVSLKVFPNPSNGSTTIEFKLDQIGKAALSIYSIQGNLVATHTLSGEPGTLQTWYWPHLDQKGNPVSSGVYLLQARDSQVHGKKLLVLK